MFKLLGVSVLLAFATSKSIDDFSGDWVGLKTFPEEQIPTGCDKAHATIAVTEDVCETGKDTEVPVIETVTHRGTSKLPVIVVENEEGGLKYAYVNVTCKGRPSPHMVFRLLNDNYFMIYRGQLGSVHVSRFIAAKKVPSETELDKFVSTIEELKDRKGKVICTRDMMDLSGNKKTKANKAKHWMESFNENNAE